MPQVAPALVKDRAARLRARAEARRRDWLLSLIGTRQTVLAERPGDRGHAGNFAEVRLPSSPVGDIVNVTIQAVENGQLIA
jgi:threonylcarbamoyladenosine tRNA methylthiotransferase MtaB